MTNANVNLRSLNAENITSIQADVHFVVYLDNETKWTFKPNRLEDGLEEAWANADEFEKLFEIGIWNQSSTRPTNDANFDELASVSYVIDGVKHICGLALVINGEYYYEEQDRDDVFAIWRKHFEKYPED